MSLRIIATGGTFDKHYDPITGQLVFVDSVLPEALARARITDPISVEPLMAIDSLDMNNTHRAQILSACERSAEHKIVIIHGTDTLRETAQVLGQAGLQKTIVLTGAMVPYRVASSDALFNLGFAVAVTQLNAPGVFVAMNGRVFSWDKVRKNKTDGIFENAD
jgi:L-asparaginase